MVGNMIEGTRDMNTGEGTRDMNTGGGTGCIIPKEVYYEKVI